MILKTSAEWQEECTVIVLNPDGWGRKNYQYSWYEEKITREKFEKRMCSSTCLFTKSVFNDKGEELNWQ